MRELTSHRGTALNDVLQVTALDGPGPGGASHQYAIVWSRDDADWDVVLKFQNGPLGSTPPNGLSIEALLAVCADRLEDFQRGEFACRENAIAITKIQEAMQWLYQRARDRIARGVEGKLER